MLILTTEQILSQQLYQSQNVTGFAFFTHFTCMQTRHHNIGFCPLINYFSQQNIARLCSFNHEKFQIVMCNE